MKNPYFIDEPTVISFSGGRTSAYMLHKCLEAHGGKLPEMAKVLFANTGKEMPETLDFVNECSDRWNVDITWIELDNMYRLKDQSTRKVYHWDYKVTDYSNASRNGEPFKMLLNASTTIPNSAMRICTSFMKIKPMLRYLKANGFESPWQVFIGIRADEERRAVKLHNKYQEGQDQYCPLYVDGITKKDIYAFWESSPFDLNLPNNNGTTDFGNCDLCFLKGKRKRMSIIKARPDLADWWIKAEKDRGEQFRPDEISYEQMKTLSEQQDDMFADAYDDSIPCFCGD